MQEMYFIVFICRYVDLLWSFYSIYNSAMKILFIISTGYIIYLMRCKPPVCATYEPERDNFMYPTLVLPVAGVLAVVTTPVWSVPNLLWDFSIWVEAVSILPQLQLLQISAEIQNLSANFVFCMGLYRACYIVNWVLLYFSDGEGKLVAWIGGAAQTFLYLDFFYYYARAKWYGEKMSLPMMSA
jgi:ER lumen protein retaining receptor